MAAISARNRLAAILLQSNTALTVREISANWPGRNQPTTQQITQLLAKDNRFLSFRKTRGVQTWTHIDHSLLNPSEEE